MNYDVKRLHVELTDKCNARCPLCPRTDPNDIYRTTSFVKNTEITFEDFKSIVDQIKFQSYLFCGNYGDPLSAKDFLKIIEYIADKDTEIHISTNASVKTPSYFKRLGEILSVNPNNILCFDLDGLEDTHSFYRRNTNFNKIIENAKSYIANTKAKSRWQYLIFDHNKHQVKEAESMARSLGFTEFRYRYSSWFPNGDSETFYENGEAYTIKRAYSDKAVKLLDKIQCISMENGEIFLSAEGYLWPCCYTASRYTHDTDLKEIVEKIGIDSINARKHGIEEIMDGMIWSEIENRWPLRRPRACNSVCAQRNNRSVNQDVVL